MPDASVIEPSPFRNADSARLLERYDTHFSAHKADTPELLHQSFALRYQVYCLERQFEDAAQHQGRRETDIFDPQSVHGLVLHRPTQEAVGTARLILPRGNHLPIVSILAEAGIDAQNHFPVTAAAEISRFAISRQFNRLRYEQADKNLSPAEWNGGRNYSLPCLGLVQILLRLSLECEVQYWAAVMEPKLMRMFAIMGIRFTSVGPLVAHHGIRQPGICHVPAMLETLRREKPEHWDIIADAGKLSYARADCVSRTAA